MDKELFERLSSALKAVNQASLFGSPLESLEKACEDFLKVRGYRVIKSQKYNHSKVKNLGDLIALFYGLLNNKLDSMNDFESYRNNMVQDMATAKRFVESRMVANGVDKDIALRECANIIQTVFDNYDEFKFKYQVTFSIFGQKKLSWVTEKAIQLLNKSIEGEVKNRVDAKIQAVIEQQDESSLGYSDIDELLAKIKEKEHGE